MFLISHKTFLLCFGLIVIQFLIFVPLLTFDERRIEKRRNFCICCIKHEEKFRANVEMIAKNSSEENINDNNNNTVSVDVTANSTNSTDNINASGPQTNDLPASGQSKLKKNNLLSKISMEYILINLLVPILIKRLYRIIIFCFFTTIFILSIISFRWIDTETDPTQLGKCIST